MTEITDDVLQFLVWFVAQGERQGGLSLTVTVGGTLVTGLLISEQEYFSRVGTMFSRGVPGLSAEGRESLDRFWSTWVDRREQSPEDKVMPAFLHLADAHVIVGNGIGVPHPAGVLWRCRLDEVDGYFFEQLVSGGERASTKQVQNDDLMS
jgi:hypothetical protein